MCSEEMMAYTLSQRTTSNPFLSYSITAKPCISPFYCVPRRLSSPRSPESLSGSSARILKASSRSPPRSVISVHAQALTSEATNKESEQLVRIRIDKSADEETSNSTIIDIVAPNWPGILASITAKFKFLELQIVKASVDLDEGFVSYKFWIQDGAGNKIVDTEQLQNVEEALRRLLDPALWSELGKNVRISNSFGDQEVQRKRRLLWLMDQYLKNDVPSIQKSIVDHVEYTIARSRFKFDDFEAYKVSCFYWITLFRPVVTHLSG